MITPVWIPVSTEPPPTLGQSCHLKQNGGSDIGTVFERIPAADSAGLITVNFGSPSDVYIEGAKIPFTLVVTLTDITAFPTVTTTEEEYAFGPSNATITLTPPDVFHSYTDARIKRRF